MGRQRKNRIEFKAWDGPADDQLLELSKNIRSGKQKLVSAKVVTNSAIEIITEEVS